MRNQREALIMTTFIPSLRKSNMLSVWDSNLVNHEAWFNQWSPLLVYLFLLFLSPFTLNIHRAQQLYRIILLVRDWFLLQLPVWLSLDSVFQSLACTNWTQITERDFGLWIWFGHKERNKTWRYSLEKEKEINSSFKDPSRVTSSQVIDNVYSWSCSRSMSCLYFVPKPLFSAQALVPQVDHLFNSWTLQTSSLVNYRNS